MTTDTELEKTEYTEKITQVLELVEGMSLLEASQLVKAFEEKFGVSASAVMAAPAGRYGSRWRWRGCCRGKK